MTAVDKDNHQSDSITAAEARKKILQQLQRVEGQEILPVPGARGRVLVKDVQAPLDVPGFRNSAMDGYAYIGNGTSPAEVSGRSFKLIGKSMAGHPFEGELARDECIRITTGAMVPDSADTVVMQENTDVTDSVVVIKKAPETGFNVREIGSNIAKGCTLLSQGTTLNAAEIGVLASSGITDVEVVRKLRVAVFSTGDELADPGAQLRDGQIFDSNRYMLTALLENAGIEVTDLGIVEDSLTALEECMTRVNSADVAISSGGVSVGDADYVREVLEQKGVVHLWKILMKPGRPLTHASLSSGTCYFGLPGNPVSGIVTFHQFVQPALQRLMGKADRLELTLNATVTTTLAKEAGRMELQRGVLFKGGQQDWQVKTTGLQDSHVLTSMSSANCFVVLPESSTGAQAGEQVEVIPFSNYQVI